MKRGPENNKMVGGRGKANPETKIPGMNCTMTRGADGIIVAFSFLGKDKKGKRKQKGK